MNILGVCIFIFVLLSIIDYSTTSTGSVDCQRSSWYDEWIDENGKPKSEKTRERSFIIGCIIVGIFVTDAFSSNVNAGEFSAKMAPGVPAESGEFPFIGSLQLKVWHLGAFSLVSKKVGITSANCLEGLPIEQVRGYLGDIQRGRGVEVQLNTTYPLEPRYKNKDNVVSVLIFTRPVSFTESIQPIALPPETFYIVGDDAKFASWGSANEEPTPETTLHKLVFKIVNKYDYQSCLPEKRDSIVVAKPYSGGFRTYTEDRGGPLVINVDGKDHIFGVFSKTFEECPSVVFFTSVRFYRSAIQKIIDSNEE